MRQIPALAAFLTLSAAQSAPAPIEGMWKNPSASAIINIQPCGTSYCGKVVWASTKGQREVAKNAPQLIGTTVLSGLRSDGNRWTGVLYSPDDNIHVSAKLQLISARQLKLTGCALAGLLCRSQVWTRSDGPLPASD